MNLRWLIIGGGIHGVHLAVRLMAEGGVEAGDLRIMDPAAALLARWRACTATTGMTHLRSPGVHHLDIAPWSLQRFAGKRRNRKPGLFKTRFEVPSLALFNAHCDSVVKDYGLDALHIQDRATSCTVECDRVVVRGAQHQVTHAERVVLAIGAGERPCWPDWAPLADPRVQHIFQVDFDGWPQSASESVVVIGGGISAAQTALRLGSEGHRVHMICRHEPRRHQFDSDSGWLGSRFVATCCHTQDMTRRRSVIDKARHRGSMTPRVWRALRSAMGQSRVEWHKASVDTCACAGGDLAMTLSDGAEVRAQRVLLATGFESSRPGGAMVDGLIESASLPCAKCGFPVVDKALRWHPRVYVSGPLAELEIGPMSRNIVGARKAGERIVCGQDEKRFKGGLRSRSTR